MSTETTKGEVCFQHVVARKEKRILHTAECAKVCTFSAQLTPLILSSWGHQTEDTWPVQREEHNSLSKLICRESFLSIYVYQRWYVRANLMPTQGVWIHPQMAVGTRVRLVRRLLVPLSPAGSLTAPQGATRRVGRPGDTKVWPRVCLVVRPLSARGQQRHRIGVLLQHSNSGYKMEQCSILTLPQRQGSSRQIRF